MSEFAPICIYLVISLLLSLIPLGVPFPFSSKSSGQLAYKCYVKRTNDVFSKRMCRFRVFFPLLGTLIFGRFLGAEGTAIITTPEWLLTFFLLLVSLILIYRIRVSRGKKSSFFFFLILILIFFFCTLVRYIFFSLLAGMTGALIWQVSSGSSESGNATSLPALESSSSSESLATFRAEIAAENEAEIYARIRSLQSCDYYNLPPQNNPGEYEGLVRAHFDQALHVPHYRNILDMEYFELTVLERKGLLQDRLFNLMLGEQNLSRIMELSPYTNIRREAYDFLESKVEPVNAMQHSFQRHIMDGSLNSFIEDINRNGRNSEIYREFYSHFTDEDFRRKLGLPLP